MKLFLRILISLTNRILVRVEPVSQVPPCIEIFLRTLLRSYCSPFQTSFLLHDVYFPRSDLHLTKRHFFVSTYGSFLT